MPEQQDDLKRIVQEVKEQVASLTLEVRKLRRRLTLASIYGIVKFVVIVGPIIFSLWYFRPQIQNFYSSWTKLYRAVDVMTSNPQPSQGANADVLEQLRDTYPQFFR